MVACELYELPLNSNEQLVAAVESYSQVVTAAARSRSDLDINLADCIARCCLLLLAEHWYSADEHQRRLIQCACHYFIDDDDENSDLDSVFGFDDDAELMNLIVVQLDRPDLAIPI